MGGEVIHGGQVGINVGISTNANSLIDDNAINANTLTPNIQSSINANGATRLLPGPSPRKQVGKRKGLKFKPQKVEGMWQSPLEHIHLPRSMQERIHQLMASPLLQAELKHVCKQVFGPGMDLSVWHLSRDELMLSGHGWYSYQSMSHPLLSSPGSWSNAHLIVAYNQCLFSLCFSLLSFTDKMFVTPLSHHRFSSPASRSTTYLLNESEPLRFLSMLLNQLLS